MRKSNGSGDDVYVRAGAFLAGLFKQAAVAVDGITSSTNATGISEIAFVFRERMTAGQTVKESNNYRSNFYNSVVKHAKEVSLLLNLEIVRLAESSSRMKVPLGSLREK
jgi:hypothetical protein